MPLYLDYIKRYIYALVDPRKYYKICYIGQTQDIKKRFNSHISTGKTGKNVWIKDILDSGHKPQMVILEVIENSNAYDAFEYEVIWSFVAARDGYLIVTNNECQTNSAKGVLRDWQRSMATNRRMPKF